MSIVRRIVIQPYSVGFVSAVLDQPIKGSYMVTGSLNKKALVANVYGTGTSVNMKVINDSDNYITFKKTKSVGHAESAELVTDPAEYNNIYQAKHSWASQSVNVTQDLPEHLQQMFQDDISNLSEIEKSEFKELLLEYQDVFSKDEFDLGCLNSGVEHKIHTHDEIPVAEKFRRTPLHFQKQEQGVIEPSVLEWSAPAVLVRKKQVSYATV